MGFYLDRKLYLQGICEAHPVVRHNQPISDVDTRLRQSFFGINDEEEFLAACVNWIFFPCVVQFGLSGGLLNKSTSIKQLNTNTWIFLQKLELDQNNPVVSEAIDRAYDVTFDVMMDFIGTVESDFENDECCGVFTQLDLGKFKWEQYGPVGDQLYGWILKFSDETKSLVTA